MSRTPGLGHRRFQKGIPAIGLGLRRDVGGGDGDRWAQTTSKTENPLLRAPCGARRQLVTTCLF
eukprot:8775679-Pyramimonas_sp.AAC.1